MERVHIEAPLDAAVVGGGAAGTYAAYRLQAEHPDWSIALLEATGRIGGRLLSIIPPGGESGLRVELGGMRFRHGHVLVREAVRSLGLETRPFVAADPQNACFLRGLRWTGADGAKPRERVYRLDASERGKSAVELLETACERAVPGSTSMANAELEARIPSVEFNGRPLYEWSMTDVYAATLTPDAHQLLVDTFGFYSGIGPHNAADGIPYLLREAGAILEDQETPVDGMERLPRELADRFSAGGGSVRLGYRLLGFDVEPGVGDLPGLRLRFQGKPPIMAHRLILAVPRVALEAVAAASPVLHGPEITDLLGATEAYAAHKFYLVYERPWWRDGGSTSRHDVSDLPLRKTYYLDSETAPSGTPALLLASYADGVQLDPWRELADLDSPGDESRPFGAPDRWQDFRAPEALVQAAQAQLSALHDRPQVPEPIASMYQRWDLERQGGGWHYWRKGARYWEVKERIVQPVDDLPVFVCGEAYSTSQAWVEGAFETAEAVLDRIA